LAIVQERDSKRGGGDRRRSVDPIEKRVEEGGRGKGTGEWLESQRVWLIQRKEHTVIEKE
jgi:hypothetical protein